MSTHYMQTLLIRGAAIQSAIDREQARPLPDGLRLLQLKKLRLVVADRLNRLKRRQAAVTPSGPSREAASCH